MAVAAVQPGQLPRQEDMFHSALAPVLHPLSMGLRKQIARSGACVPLAIASVVFIHISGLGKAQGRSLPGDVALAAEVPLFSERPGEMEFCGVMVARPLQLTGLEEIAAYASQKRARRARALAQEVQRRTHD